MACDPLLDSSQTWLRSTAASFVHTTFVVPGQRSRGAQAASGAGVHALPVRCVIRCVILALLHRPVGGVRVIASCAIQLCVIRWCFTQLVCHLIVCHPMVCHPMVCHRQVCVHCYTDPSEASLRDYVARGWVGRPRPQTAVEETSHLC